MNVVRLRSLAIVVLLGVVIAAAPLAPASSAPAGRKRCAFDIGSGETKLSAAEIISVKPIPVIYKLRAKKVLLPFARSLKDGAIPDWLIEEAIAKLRQLRSECDAVGAREYSGVATSGFRMARNAHRALTRISQETKIPLRVITGEQEAVLGFLAAEAGLQSDGKKLVVWDIGGGSLQFSMRADGFSEVHRDYVISAGHKGAELFRRELAVRFNRGSTQAVNPMTQAEMTQAIDLAKAWSRAVNPKIVEQLRRGETRVAGLGGIHTESLAGQAGLQFDSSHEHYTLDGVRAAANRAVGMSDADFRSAYPANKYPESQASNLALVLGYMEGLGITEVIPMELTPADGLLVDETYWAPSKRQ